MSGFSTNGMNIGTTYTGSERAAFDTQNPSGANPQVEAVSILKLATLARYFGSAGDLTPTAGTRYIVSVGVGSDAAATPGADTLLTGVNVELGSVGGTNNLIVELHDSTGALVATSAIAGTLAGTAARWQQIPCTVPYRALSGTYYVTVQANGNTVRLNSYVSPTSGHRTGSVAGTFGTGASITPPTTYTSGAGPIVQLY